MAEKEEVPMRELIRKAAEASGIIIRDIAKVQWQVDVDRIDSDNYVAKIRINAILDGRA